jgi:hypothetical protein
MSRVSFVFFAKMQETPRRGLARLWHKALAPIEAHDCALHDYPELFLRYHLQPKQYNRFFPEMRLKRIRRLSNQWSLQCRSENEFLTHPQRYLNDRMGGNQASLGFRFAKAWMGLA